MKKNIKYILFGLYVLSFIVVASTLIWIYTGDAPPLCMFLGEVFFVIWLVTGLIMIILSDFKNTSLKPSKADKFEIRAEHELCSAIVEVNNLYQLMLTDTAHKEELEEAYLKAREVFQIKAKMYDAVFHKNTVIVDGKDENGNVIEITFESHSR